MTARTRTTTLLLATVTTLLVACGTNAGAPTSQAPDPTQPSQPSSPSVAPSEAPSAPVAEEREAGGTITVAEGMAFSGPGATIEEALAMGPTEGDLPNLVRGVMFRDLDGQIYLATAVTDTETPTFDGPMLRVAGMDNTGESWDMANAELLGLQEANGIVFHPEHTILGFITIP